MRWFKLLTVLMVVLSMGCAAQEEFEPSIAISWPDGENVSGSSIVYEAQGGQTNINIVSNAAWRVECNADWVVISQRSGDGDAVVTLSVGNAEKARSAVVTVELVKWAMHHNFDVVQYAPKEPQEPDTPEEPINPSEPEEPSEPSEPQEPETPEEPINPSEPQEPQEPQEPSEPDEPSEPSEPDEPFEPSEPQEPENPEEPTNPSEPQEPETPDDDKPQQELFDVVTSVMELAEGSYYIGGYTDSGMLYLATGGLTSVNHCNTAQYSYVDGALSSTDNRQPAAIYLEKAETVNCYYVRFADDGYLTATGVGAGKLQFIPEKEDYWRFVEHEDDGFELRHSKYKVKLIISRKATESVLRSIADYEEGCAVLLFKRREK